MIHLDLIYSLCAYTIHSLYDDCYSLCYIYQSLLNVECLSFMAFIIYGKMHLIETSVTVFVSMILAFINNMLLSKTMQLKYTIFLLLYIHLEIHCEIMTI